jgi:hypothetical protein
MKSFEVGDVIFVKNYITGRIKEGFYLLRAHKEGFICLYFYPKIKFKYERLSFSEKYKQEKLIIIGSHDEE